MQSFEIFLSKLPPQVHVVELLCVSILGIFCFYFRSGMEIVDLLFIDV